MELAYRVASRFLCGEVIADPKDKLREFQLLADTFCRHEDFAKAELAKIHAFIEAGTRSDQAARQRLSDELTKSNRERYEIKSEFQLSLNFRRMRPDGQALFWAIIQQYELVPKLRRGIEKGSRFWSKSKLSIRLKNKPYSYEADAEYLKAYVDICSEIRSQVTNAQAAIVAGKLHSDPEVAAKTNMTAGAFTLVNTGGFAQKIMDRAQDVAHKAEQAMRSIGQGRACYGKILISQTINNKRTVAAFYHFDSDEMFVRANTPDDWDTVRIVCHELAHRLHHKFLQGKQGEIAAIYRRLNTQELVGVEIPDEIMPQINDTLEVNGKKLTVVKVDRRRNEVQYKQEGAPANVLYAEPVMSWLKKKGIEPHHQPDFRGFITRYAGKNPDENFAEMVSFYALGKLPASQVELLEPVLR